MQWSRFGLPSPSLSSYNQLMGLGNLVAGLFGASVALSGNPSHLKKLAIYYGWPSKLNEETLQGDLPKIATFFDQFDLVVFGAGLELDQHEEHARLKEILSHMKALSFGYIPLGKASHLSISQIEEKITLWKNTGVKGIFLDEAGFDFWDNSAEMRQRQIQSIVAIHKHGLKAILNAWKPEDLFEGKPALPLSKEDFVLYESYVFTSGKPLAFSEHLTRIQQFHKGLKKSGASLLGVTTTHSPHHKQEDFSFAARLATLDGLAGLGWGMKNFSATQEDANRLTAFELPQEEIKAGSIDTENALIQITIDQRKIHLDFATRSVR